MVGGVRDGNGWGGGMVMVGGGRGMLGGGGGLLSLRHCTTFICLIYYFL